MIKYILYHKKKTSHAFIACAMGYLKDKKQC